jgi:hypothetical protein
MDAMTPQFRIRYWARHAEGSGSALMVEDSEGALYLFSRGELHLRLDPLTGNRHLEKYFARARHVWRRVESDAVHPLAALPALERAYS